MALHITRKSSLFFVLSLLIVVASEAKDLFIKKDFRNDWLVYQNNEYQPFDKCKGEINAVYFWLESAAFSGDSLYLAGTKPFAVFVNGQVIQTTTNALTLSIDSLHSLFSSPNLLIGIYQKGLRAKGLSTVIQVTSATSANDLLPMSFSSFRDFVITGMLILLVMLIVIIQLDPKLASDYFSVTKIFSLREGDDKQVYSRITSSTSILFYCFCSLILGYYLILIFHFVPLQYGLANLFYADAFSSAFVLWLQLSLIIVGFFFLKVLVVFLSTYLFGYTELAGIHFFNWVRLLLVVFGTLTSLLFLYVIAHGQNENVLSSLFIFMAWVLTGWMFLIFLKLMTRNSRSMFHLFLYLCATELIPFLLTINLLY